MYEKNPAEDTVCFIRKSIYYFNFEKETKNNFVLIENINKKRKRKRNQKHFCKMQRTFSNFTQQLENYLVKIDQGTK